MCTAITFAANDHYFGRNLDFEHGFGESVAVTPRNLPLPFRCMPTLTRHYAMVGMASVDGQYPLYFDATNEKGLSMAGLYFPDNAVYSPIKEDMDNIAPYELIPWILGQCATVNQAKKLLSRLNLAALPYSDACPLSPLHFLLADKTCSIVIEPMGDGLHISENPIGVLTNNPPFDYHMTNLSNYLNLTREEPSNRFAPQYPIDRYSRGMGGIGLPGDLSSSSRFVRAAFTKLNAVCDEAESAAVSQFFHILGAVSQPRGCVKVGEDFEKTIYTSCCNTDRGVYYYTTYENSQITGVDMHRTDLDGNTLSVYPLVTGQQIRMEN